MVHLNHDSGNIRPEIRKEIPVRSRIRRLVVVGSSIVQWSVRTVG